MPPLRFAPPAAALALAFLLSACVPVEEGRSLAQAGAAGSPDSVVATPETELGAVADFPAASRYETLIARYAEENGVPLPLAHAVVEKESGYDARARGRGTLGLMQIKPATARGIGYGGPADGLYDPETNLQWGMKYLGDAYKLGGGDTCGAALRYQGGHRATRQTAMTRKYCAELKAIMAKRGS